MAISTPSVCKLWVTTHLPIAAPDSYVDSNSARDLSGAEASFSATWFRSHEETAAMQAAHVSARAGDFARRARFQRMTRHRPQNVIYQPTTQ